MRFIPYLIFVILVTLSGDGACLMVAAGLAYGMHRVTAKSFDLDMESIVAAASSYRVFKAQVGLYQVSISVEPGDRGYILNNEDHRKCEPS